MYMKNKRKISHNKKRNTGLNFYLLNLALTESLLSKDKKKFSKIIEIIENNFKKDSVLDIERRLADLIVETQGVSVNIAKKILRESKMVSSNINSKRLEEAKSTLISHIHKTFGKDFYVKNKINDNKYRAYASAQVYFNCCRANILKENVDKIFVEETLINWLQKPVEENKAIKMKTDPLIYKLMNEKFSNKLDSFNVLQKNILKNFVLFGQDKQKYLKFLNEEKIKIKKCLSDYLLKIENSNPLFEKINRCLEKLENLNENKYNDSIIEEFLLFRDLTEEISNE